MSVKESKGIQQVLFSKRWWILTALILVIFTLWTAEFQEANTTAVLAGTLRHSTPLVLGAMCGLLCERSGVINIGIEGQMLMSAWGGFMVASTSGSLLLGLFAGIVIGMMMGGVLAGISVGLRGDQIIAGTVINIAAIGITSFFFSLGRTLPSGKTQVIKLGPLADIPVAGRVLFSNKPITFLTLLLIPTVWFLLFRTDGFDETARLVPTPLILDVIGVARP